MEHRDAEMSQVTIILRAPCDGNVPSAVEQLKAVGLSVTNVDPDNGVIEGDIESAKVHDIKTLQCVEAARVTFDWIADYPPGDARDQDGEDAEER